MKRGVLFLVLIKIILFYFNRSSSSNRSNTSRFLELLRSPY